MTTQQSNQEGNIFLAVALALIFFVVAVLGMWYTMPAARRGVVQAVPVEESVVEAAVEPEAVAPQTLGGDPVAGQAIFTATCAACHGPAGEGVVGLGKDMTTSEFITSQSDAELVEFIKMGRDPSDPLNTTGVAMPARGGNPALSDEDLVNVVSFVRSLQQ